MDDLELEPYRVVYDQSPLAFEIMQLIMDDNQQPVDVQLIYANQALVELQQVDLIKMQGLLFSSIFNDPDKRWLKACSRVGLQGEIVCMSDHNPLSKKDIKMLCYPLKEGYIASYSEEIKDSTEQKMTEEKKRNLLAKMSHDLRTPMNAIYGFSELGLSSTTYEETFEYLQKIYLSAHYMQNLLNDCLDMNKIDIGRMKIYLEPCSYEELICGIRASLIKKANQKNQTLTFSEIATHQRRVMLDIMHLRQVLTILIDNAIKFTPEGGNIECLTEALVPMNGFLPIQFIIRDNGIGMSREFIENELFHEFSRENQNSLNNPAETGAGLGLCIAHYLLEMMNGSIRCNSVKGEGTVFTVSLLVKIKEEKDFRQEFITENDAILEGKRVLVCEDHEINAMLTEKMLEKKKMLYDWAKDGREGVAQYESHSSGYYDAIIMDMRMPNMNGVEATKRIRSMGRADSATIPIIAMTANAFTEDAQACREAGMTEYLSKPIDIKQVYVTLTKVLQ